MGGLTINGLCKSFDTQAVLDDINLEVSPGDLLVVLGPSGCGKSTLLRLIAGLEIPDRGTIVLDGRDITALEPQKRKTAMVFQNYALYPHMTVYENLAFPLRVIHTAKPEMDRMIRRTAELLELDQLLDRRPAQLSGGQRQRVALGRGLVRQPSIFLLDEPLSNLDAALRVRMRQEIVALQKRLGITMVYVTHDQTAALPMADRMIVLKDGRVRQSGVPDEIYNNPADTFVAGFVGAPAINLFEDEINGGQGRRLNVTYGPETPDGTYMVGLRPERILLRYDGQLEGEVVGVEYIGSASHLRVTSGEITLTITAGGSTTGYQIGRRLRFAIPSDALYCFDINTGRRIR